MHALQRGNIKLMDRLVLQEIKASRVESVDFNSDVPSKHSREKRYVRTTGSQWRNRRSEIQSWKRRSGSSRSSSRQRRIRTEDDHNTFATMGSLGSNRPRRKSEGSAIESADKEIVHDGWLHKTTRTKITLDLRKGQHEHRQHRRFQLTEHSLEYSQLLQKVCHTVLLCLYFSELIAINYTGHL